MYLKQLRFEPMHLLVHPPITNNYTFFKSFLQSIPTTNPSSYFIEQTIPIASLNTQISSVRIAQKETDSRSTENIALHDSLLSRMKCIEKDAVKYLNELYTPEYLQNEHKKTMMIKRKVCLGNIDKLCETVIKMEGLVDTCREFLLVENCPLAFLERKYSQYVNLKNEMYYKKNNMDNVGKFEDVTKFVLINFSRDEYMAEVYNGRMVFAELYVMLRIGDYGRIDEYLNDYEFIFSNICKGFTGLMKEYIKSKKTCEEHKGYIISIANENQAKEPSHKCSGTFMQSYKKESLRLLNEISSNDKFLIFILHLINEKNTSLFIKTLEDFLWFNLIIKTPEKTMITLFETYPNREGKLLFYILYELYDNAMEFLFTQDFDVCESYTLMKMICENKKSSKINLLAELTFAIVTKLTNKDYIQKFIGDLQSIISLSSIAKYIIDNDMVGVIGDLKLSSLTNEVSLKLKDSNRYEVIIKNYEFFNDEILIDSFNEIVIQNLLGNIKTSKTLIENSFKKITSMKNTNLRKSYVLKLFLKYKDTLLISDLQAAFNSDYYLIESMDVYERIATYVVKTIKDNCGQLAKEFNEFMCGVGLSKKLIDKLNSELIGYL